MVVLNDWFLLLWPGVGPIEGLEKLLHPSMSMQSSRNCTSGANFSPPMACNTWQPGQFMGSPTFEGHIIRRHHPSHNSNYDVNVRGQITTKLWLLNYSLFIYNSCKTTYFMQYEIGIYNSNSEIYLKLYPTTITRKYALTQTVLIPDGYGLWR